MKRFAIAFALLAMSGAPVMANAQGTDTAETEGEMATEARTDIGRALDRFMSEEGDSLILLPHRLDKNKLDYSLESLNEIDKWLGSIHQINRLEAGDGRVGDLFKMDGRGDNSVTFAGLYLGEVVRQNAEHDWVWQPFDLFVANNPAHAEYFGNDAGFDTYILVSEQGAATPINAAFKRTVNGSIDSVHYMGLFLSKPVDMDAALKGADYTGLSATGPVPNGTSLGAAASDAEAEAEFEALKAAQATAS